MQRRYGAHVDPAQHQGAGFLQRFQCRWNQLSRWSKDDGGVQSYGRRIVSTAHPFGSQFARQLAVLFLTSADQDSDLPMECDLDGDVPCGPESVDCESVAGLQIREP